MFSLWFPKYWHKACCIVANMHSSLNSTWCDHQGSMNSHKILTHGHHSKRTKHKQSCFLFLKWVPLYPQAHVVGKSTMLGWGLLAALGLNAPLKIVWKQTTSPISHIEAALCMAAFNRTRNVRKPNGGLPPFVDHQGSRKDTATQLSLPFFKILSRFLKQWQMVRGNVDMCVQ